jgi:hypothetical protein
VSDVGDDTVSDLLDRVWRHLGRGAADRRHPARHPTLATLGPEGPEARTLVLRSADRSAARLELHTDMASPKVAQIAAEPRVALHVWIPKDRLQIRIRAIASVAPGDPALFARLPVEARRNYGGAVPGAPPAPEGEDGDPARFASITLEIRQIDALVLDAPHRRAVFEAPDWAGRWVAP